MRGRTHPITGIHLRLFFKTINTSLCVPIKYVRHHAYHQSAYIYTRFILSIMESVINWDAYLVVGYEDRLGREIQSSDVPIFISYDHCLDLLVRKVTLTLPFKRNRKSSWGKTLVHQD